MHGSQLVGLGWRAVDLMPEPHRKKVDTEGLQGLEARECLDARTPKP